MRKLLSIVVAIAAVLCSSTSYAAAVVTYLGTSAATVSTNALTSGGDLVTSGAVPDSVTFNSNFVGSVNGLFDAYLVSVDSNGFSPLHFSENVLGIIASNAFGDVATALPRDLFAEFETATGIATGLSGNNNLALDIFSVNPDLLNVSGVTITANGGFTGPNSFIALVAVPEPSSLAICSIGGIGIAVAGRRRFRKKSA
ncbi:MAG TPA: PEP-CTERM sorting domain-containing protein [Pirellula sp.]|nr:PEP-CTERM sorting domain-containing protein [Pirellula sp.]